MNNQVYNIVVNGDKYSLLVEAKDINATHMVNAIILENDTKNYYEAITIINPKQIKETKKLKVKNHENLSLDDCLLNQVRVWNTFPFDKIIE